MYYDKKMRVILTDSTQSKMQRGFTRNLSPMNCSLIVEEFMRDCKDKEEDVFIALLYAETAFGVVCHSHLMRKLYHTGLTGNLWTTIKRYTLWSYLLCEVGRTVLVNIYNHAGRQTWRNTQCRFIQSLYQ